VSEAQWIDLQRARIVGILDPEKDCVRGFYQLDKTTLDRIEHHGVRSSADFGGLLVIWCIETFARPLLLGFLGWYASPVISST